MDAHISITQAKIDHLKKAGAVICGSKISGVTISLVEASSGEVREFTVNVPQRDARKGHEKLKQCGEEKPRRAEMTAI